MSLNTRTHLSRSRCRAIPVPDRGTGSSGAIIHMYLTCINASLLHFLCHSNILVIYNMSSLSFSPAHTRTTRCIAIHGVLSFLNPVGNWSQVRYNAPWDIPLQGAVMQLFSDCKLLLIYLVLPACQTKATFDITGSRNRIHSNGIGTIPDNRTCGIRCIKIISYSCQGHNIING